MPYVFGCCPLGPERVISEDKEVSGLNPFGVISLVTQRWDSEIVLHPPLHRTEKEKLRYLLDSRVSFTDLVPER